MSKYYKVSVKNTGGEYTYGFITKKEEIELVMERINNGEELELEMSNENEEVVQFFEKDQLLHVYGPDINNSKISVALFEDEDCTEEIEEIMDEEDLIEEGIKVFTTSNPYITKDILEQYDSDTLQMGAFVIEKNIEVPVVFELSDEEEFDIDNIFVGTVNLDETLCGDEIVEKIYYIRPNHQQEILKEYLKEGYEEEQLEDYIGEIYQDFKESKNEKIKDILDKYCDGEVLAIEGQGFSKGEYIVIRNMEEEILGEKPF